MNIETRLPRSAGLAALLLAGSASASFAQEKITLRLADSLPAGHVIHELVAKPFDRSRRPAAGQASIDR